MRAVRNPGAAAGYGAAVSERSSYPSRYPYEDTGPASAPFWELLGHGTATGPRDPLTGEPGPASGLTPWFNIRFTLGDGSRVDVLAAVLGGRAHIEELRAEPPLSPQDLAGLSAWIGASLEDAFPTVAGAPYEARTNPGGAAAPTVWTLGSYAVPPEAPAVRENPVAVVQERPAEPSPPPRVRRRARRWGARGRVARRAAAETYLAARERGEDPVLAVMCATGHSRRKSLRIIAGARDDGFLTPRHIRG